MSRSLGIPGRCARVLGVCAGLLGLVCASAALGACKVMVVGEIPVVTAHNRVLTVGKVNGQPLAILIDTGSPFSLMRESAARRLGLPLIKQQGFRESQEISIYGVGGRADSGGTTAVKQLQIGSFERRELTFLVLGDSPRTALYPDLLLGEALLSRYSTEFDLAHRMVRLLDTESCEPDEVAYWTDKYSLADMEPWNVQQPRIQVKVLLNGMPFTAILDTGQAHSIITRDAAARAGVAPWREGVAPVTKSSGLGRETEDTWVGTFATFTLGDESVKNVQLLISDLFRADSHSRSGSRLPGAVEGLPSMIVGCDFFLAHRVLVLSRQHKLVFTYDGGPIFTAEEPEPRPAQP
jgi:predicted aspartyl protease